MILILGFGKEGKSTRNFLVSTQRVSPEKIKIYDQNLSLADYQKLDQIPWDDFTEIWLSPGISINHVPKPNHEIVTNQVQHLLSQTPASHRSKIISITGSKGKSTTSKFIAEFLQFCGHKVALVGNIGTPCLDILPQLNQLDFIVLECSSFQLEVVSHSPHIGILLNCFPEHLDRHGTFHDYQLLKENIFAFQTPNDKFIAPDFMQAQCIQKPASQAYFPAPISTEIFPSNSIFQAEHFRQNFGVVTALIQILDLPQDQLSSFAAQFQGIPHRLEYIGTSAQNPQITYYNDSISTNPVPAAAAVNYFSDQSNLGGIILGGVTEGGDFGILEKSLQPNDAHVFVVQSPVGDLFLHQTQIAKSRITQYNSWDEITSEKLEEKVQSGAIIFSPAGKSFDAFDSYTTRGDWFRDLIQKNKKK